MDKITLNANNSLTVGSKPIVQIKNTISIAGSNTELPVQIRADFTNIPGHLHEIYLSALQSTYVKNV